MGVAAAQRPSATAFEEWIPLARQVVRTSLRLAWKDVFEIYTYTPTIALAEALALEARRAGSDTHITLMTDDLWFTSMRELSTKWLGQPSPVEYAIHKTVTADMYLGGPGDARRMRDIPPEKFDANAMGNFRQDEPLRKRRVRHVDLPIGRVTAERAEAYGLDYEKWHASYQAALRVDLAAIQKRGRALARSLSGSKRVHITSDDGTDFRFATKPIRPAVDDGIIDAQDVRRGFVNTALPAGRIEGAIQPESAEGEVRASDPIFFAGRTIRRPWLSVKAGKIVDWGAEEHEDLLDRGLKQSKADRARLGWFTLGLNRAAEPCMLDNSIVDNDLGLALGPHPQLEHRTADPAVSFQLTIGRVSLSIDR